MGEFSVDSWGNVRKQLALDGVGKWQDEQSEDAHLHHEDDEHLTR